MGFNIGIYDKDRAYVVGLTDYINRQSHIHMRAKAFTSFEHLKEYISGNLIDIVLTGENGDMGDTNIPIVYICDDKDICKEDLYIYKYQNLNDIANQIQNYAKGKIEKDYKLVDTYAVFSPIGRCGKTRFAKALVYHYGDGLYVGLEEYSPMGMEVYKDEFSYYFSQMNSKLIGDIGDIVCDDRGCRYLQFIDSYMDASCIGKSHVKWLLDSLKQTMKYGTITFDIGGAVLADMEILELFDVVYVPVIDDGISGLKLDKFLTMIKRQGFDHIIKKMRYIRVPDREQLDVEGIISEEKT